MTNAIISDSPIGAPICTREEAVQLLESLRADYLSLPAAARQEIRRMLLLMAPQTGRNRSRRSA